MLKRYGGVVGENHVVFLEQEKHSRQFSPKCVARLLRSTPIDRLFRSISGAANVSAFELSQLPMPNPKVLRRQLQRTTDTDAAVRRAFQETVRNKNRK
jgi:adenine-specific DNA-methyltransferase